ncbi:MAG: TIGR02391 family protein [Candidatus Taylorbacteria bacterium RIFCSPHIGHO2_01_FULL_46_22b]|uniref:TIGR02391 family protein n=1 Tax=Candidatus Taylorbacteria bacterium RIFCSPHIGHO2_01_FULL_46_22b TaxID=1802301 RepID=A0A1G2M3X9_9BACT|nr:MAG: TIGR02391 family protein [Candidatus Taylorbacteria bacterium RIFCSPHIGHO2_01_FULL_46_22b]
MSLYSEIYPLPEAVLEMEPEELAPLVLKHLGRAEQGKLNRHNFLLGTDREFVDWAGSYKQGQSVLERFSVAWMWLEKELFIAPQPGNNDWMFITHRGKKVLDSQDFDTYRQGYLLPSDGLDSILVRKVKQSFIRGDYDTAIFQAFKEVEVRVRTKAGLSEKEIGVDLMRKAFGPPSAPLVDKTAHPAEQQARMELFSGAIGTYKNPSSHRYVNLTDPREAADIIHIANTLLRIVDSIQ